MINIMENTNATILDIRKGEEEEKLRNMQEF